MTQADISVSKPFGGPVRLYVEGQGATALPSFPSADMDFVRRLLGEMQPADTGILRIYRPLPTAAVSTRDTLNPQWARAAEALRLRGFTPVERGAGGLLAVYDRAALVIDLVAAHPQPREDIHARFKLFSEMLVTAFTSVGIDARVGEVAGEYCPGSYSVNAGGRIKLVGLAQRVRRTSYHLGAVISVERSQAALDAVVEAYRILGMPFERTTFGAVTDLVPALTHDVTSSIITAALALRIDIQSTL